MERKTWKREVASLMLLYLGALFAWGAGWDNATATDSAKFLAPFIFIFAGGVWSVEGLKQAGVIGK